MLRWTKFWLVLGWLGLALMVPLSTAQAVDLAPVVVVLSP